MRSASTPEPLPQHLAHLGFSKHLINGAEVILPPLCDVPAGPFLMGSDPTRDSQAGSDEQPQQAVTLAAYQIVRYPVTVAEYACYVRALGKRPPKNWKDQLTKPDHPVVYVSWMDTLAYVRWLAQVTGQPWRLPTEVEWEKAARGTDGRIYPWGDAWDKTRANTTVGGPGATTPVGSYPSGVSPYGAQDMAGNVWEWCSTLYHSSLSPINDEREQLDAPGDRVLRGGSGESYPQFARAACRLNGKPIYHINYVGVRLALSRAQMT